MPLYQLRIMHRKQNGKVKTSRDGTLQAIDRSVK